MVDCQEGQNDHNRRFHISHNTKRFTQKIGKTAHLCVNLRYKTVDKLPLLFYPCNRYDRKGDLMTKKKRTLRPIDMAYVAMFVALMAIGANLTAMITFGSIPLTMQTFFAIMAGALLGSRLGSLSMVVYMIVGLIGVPVFAGFQAGPGTVLTPTFGFIVSFIFVAYATGKIIEARTEPALPRFFAACFVGLFLNYFIGTTLMYLALNFWVTGSHGISYAMAWTGMLPFIPKDIFFTIVAAVIAPRIYRRVRKAVPYKAA